MNSEQLWQTTLGQLELLVSKVHFTTWFRNTFVLEWMGEKIVVAVPNNFTKAWLEKKYHSAILKAIQKITDSKIKAVSYRVEARSTNALPISGGVDAVVAPVEIKTESATVANKFGLNHRYTFGNFVIGKGNELAQAASLAVAQKPGEAYNPLFIYGGVGLGKTHLVQAIGNRLAAERPQARIRYIHAEQYVTDVVRAYQQ